jgi:cytoplasmic iron level regulating protein YaaA (DUF328/UPF0246 family)
MQRRPLEIRTARGELSRILADAKAADPEDVHAFAAADRRFQAAFDELRARTRASEDELARGLLDTAAIDRARARAEAQLKKLNALKTTLAEAQTTLQDLVDRREHDIRTRILRHRPVNP